MRVIYTKRNNFYFFGIKILTLETDYIERSNDTDDDFNDEMIALKIRTFEKRK